MYPPMKMDEHREEQEKLARRIAELERQLPEYAKKKSGEIHPKNP